MANKKGPARQPVDAELVGRLVEQARASGLQLTGDRGLLQQLTKRVLEPAPEGEITDHLGYGSLGRTRQPSRPSPHSQRRRITDRRIDRRWKGPALVTRRTVRAAAAP